MAEIVWESDAQSSGFTVMSNGMVWPDDWPGTLVEAQFTSARGDGADLDRDPDMVPSGPGRVTFTPLVRTVGYDGEHGKRIVSLHPFEAVVGDDGHLYTPDEYGQPGIRGIVLPSNNSDVVDEHDWTWRVTFDIPNTTIRPTHIPTPHDHSVDIKDYLDSDANYGVRVVVDRVAARETLAARDETLAARDLVLPARDQTLAARDATLAHGITVDTSVGTRVYVGDTMIYGDTGWRDVTLLAGDALDLNNTGTISIKRESHSTVVRFSGVTLQQGEGSLNIIDLPPGFRPVTTREVAWGGTRHNHLGQAQVFIISNNTIIWSSYLDLFTDTTHRERPTSSFSGTLTFSSVAWPTSLPESPA